MLEIPVTFDRSKGDIHSLGNPHFLLDPVAAKIVAAEIAEHLAQVDPANAAKFRANLARFNSTVDQKLPEWQHQLAPYKGTKIVTYHKDFVYFAARFNLDIVETLEPKPGIAPSPAHLAQVVTAMKSTKARVILVQPYQNRKTAETVARQTGATVVDMPQQPGAVANTTSYFDLMDHLVRSLVGALEDKQ
jgi:ABC-type Zn uptake system ZnuABC Zn-binding protein ZnuA